MFVNIPVIDFARIFNIGEFLVVVVKSILIEVFLPTYRRWFAAEMGTPEAIDRLKKKDSIDAKFRLIYKPPESAMLMTATSFCAFSSIISPGFIGSYAYDRFFGRNLELVEEVSNLQLLGIGSVTVFSMAALYFCTTIPMRIYNHEKE